MSFFFALSHKIMGLYKCTKPNAFSIQLLDIYINIYNFQK
jgi:hypothetical protein